MIQPLFGIRSHRHPARPRGRGADEDQQGTNGDGLEDPNDGELLRQTVAFGDSHQAEIWWRSVEITGEISRAEISADFSSSPKRCHKIHLRLGATLLDMDKHESEIDPEEDTGNPRPRYF